MHFQQKFRIKLHKIIKRKKNRKLVNTYNKVKESEK